MLRMEPMEAVTPRPRPVWIAGVAEPGTAPRPVLHPYDRTEVATVSLARDEQVERAVAGAARLAGETRSVPAHTRASALDQLANEIEARAEEFAELVTAEAAAPLTRAAEEVALAVATLRHGARLAGETRSVPSAAPFGAALPCGVGLTRRVPRGVALGLVAPHRPLAASAGGVAAALAVGTPVVLAPTPRAPLSALALAETLADVLTAGPLPTGALSVLTTEAPDLLAGDARLCPLAWPAGHAQALVLDDWAEVESAASAIAASAADWAGQRYAPVRHVLVHPARAEPFVAALAAALEAQRTGDPYDAAVSVGPLPDDDSASRTLAWIAEATDRGATVVTGGTRSGTAVTPTLLTGLGADALRDRGVLGPVIAVSATDGTDTTGDPSDSDLTARRVAVFTRDVEQALRTADRLTAATADEVVVGDVPRHRPEDVRAAAQALTRETTTVLSGRPG